MSTTSNTSTVTLDLDSMVRAVREIENAHPIADWMRKQGFDPKDGCVLFLPESMKSEVIYKLSFVRFSKIIDSPCLVRGFKENTNGLL